MYIVKRPFRNRGVVLTAGSVIAEPATIKRFNGRLAEGKIVNVTKSNFDAYKHYFKTRYGVDITPKQPAKAVQKDETAEAKTEAKTVVKATKASAKPSASK